MLILLQWLCPIYYASALFITLLPLQGVANERALTQGVASLALGYALIGLSARALSAAPQQFKQT